MTSKLLIIDDDEALSSMLAEYLAPSGLQLVCCATVKDGLHALQNKPVDAVILDIMLPDGDGLEVCRTIRRHSDVPILMLTAKGDETDRIVGLELGADDYLPKPFNPRELLARLKAILRRTHHTGARTDVILRFGELEIDQNARTVRLNGETRTLTSHQFEILLVLAKNAGKVLSRDQLMNAVRATDLEPFDRSIDVHISRIRSAIEADPKNPARVLTVRGAGYVFTRQQSRG